MMLVSLWIFVVSWTSHASRCALSLSMCKHCQRWHCSETRPLASTLQRKNVHRSLPWCYHAGRDPQQRSNRKTRNSGSGVMFRLSWLVWQAMRLVQGTLLLQFGSACVLNSFGLDGIAYSAWSVLVHAALDSIALCLQLHLVVIYIAGTGRVACCSCL
jgi:hypothetical protein